MEPLLTTKDLCEWLKISNATAMRWRNDGMPYIGKSKSLRYKQNQVKEWLTAQINEEKK